MNNEELYKKYMESYGHLDFEPGEILSVENMVASLVFTQEEAEKVFSLLSTP